MDPSRFAGFVAEAWPGARRIVQVAIGTDTRLAQAVRSRLPDLVFLATDGDPAAVSRCNERGIPAIHDGLEHPQYGLYTGADLLVAASLPRPLLPAFEDLADAVHCDALLAGASRGGAPGKGWQRVVDGRVTLAWVRPAGRLERPRPPRPAPPPEGAPPRG